MQKQHSIDEPDEIEGPSVAHDLQVMHDARLPEYDRESTMDTYIQSYLDVSTAAFAISFKFYCRLPSSIPT